MNLLSNFFGFSLFIAITLNCLTPLPGYSVETNLIGNFAGSIFDDILVNKDGTWTLNSSSGMYFTQYPLTLSGEDINGCDQFFNKNFEGNRSIVCFDKINSRWLSGLIKVDSNNNYSLEFSILNSWTSGNWVNFGIGDFNGDGRPDLVAYDNNSANWYVSIAGSSSKLLGFFNGRRVEKWTNITTGTNFTSTYIIADFTGDKRDDILALDNTNNWWLLDPSNSKSFSAKKIGPFDLNFSEISISGTGDINGDKRAELITYNRSRSKWIIYNVTTQNKFYYWTYASWSNVVPWQAAFIDISLDGKTDIIGINPKTGDLIVAETGSNGITPSTRTYKGLIEPNSTLLTSQGNFAQNYLDTLNKIIIDDIAIKTTYGDWLVLKSIYRCMEPMYFGPGDLQVLRGKEVLVALGDSTTATRALPNGVCLEPYSRKMNSKLKNTIVINAGVGGDTTANALDRFTADVLNLYPDKVSILLGINDSAATDENNLSSRVSLDDFSQNITTMISTLKDKGIGVILMTPNRLNDYASGLTNAQLDIYINKLREIASNQGSSIKFIDINNEYNSIYTNSGNTGIASLLLPMPPDVGIHPGNNGHALVADKMIQMLDLK